MRIWKSIARVFEAQQSESPAAVIRLERGSLPFLAMVTDFETSGLSPHKARAVWVAMVTASGDTATVDASLAFAGTDGLGYYGDPPRSVQRLSRERIVARMLEGMSTADVVVAHNASFDQSFAMAEFQAAGLAMPDTPWLCTMALAQQVLAGVPNFKLETLLAHFGIDPGTPHNADADAIATTHLLAALFNEAKQQGFDSLNDLLAIAAPRKAGSWGRRESSSIIVNLFDFDEPDEFGYSSSDRWELRKSGDWPICAGMTLNQITNPAHRAVHAEIEAAWSCGLEEQRSRAERLFAANCPEAAKAFGEIPRHVEKGGTQAKFKVAQETLRRARELELVDLEMITTLVECAQEVASLATGVKSLLKASDEFDLWLVSFQVCARCHERSATCEHLSLIGAATRALLGERSSFFFNALIAAELHGVAPESRSPAASILECKARLLATAPRTWAYTLELLGAKCESAEEFDDAMSLFGRSIAAGSTSFNVFDRLSLLAERAQRYELAAATCAQALATLDLGDARQDKLAKRAARCRKKAASEST